MAPKHFGSALLLFAPLTTRRVTCRSSADWAVRCIRSFDSPRPDTDKSKARNGEHPYRPFRKGEREDDDEARRLGSFGAADDQRETREDPPPHEPERAGDRDRAERLRYSRVDAAGRAAWQRSRRGKSRGRARGAEEPGRSLPRRDGPPGRSGIPGDSAVRGERRQVCTMTSTAVVLLANSTAGRIADCDPVGCNHEAGTARREKSTPSTAVKALILPSRKQRLQPRARSTRTPSAAPLGCSI